MTPKPDTQPNTSKPIADDLKINLISNSMSQTSVDLIVSGSIGASESIKLSRSLRRLGADVFPWLTTGGAQFTTETALNWASNNPVRQQFSGLKSHIADNDICVVAPASVSMIAKIVHGITDTPASALIASYLGQDKPVIIMPNMHDTLAQSPAIKRNMADLVTLSTKIYVLPPRLEEDKLKFPAPSHLADEVSHIWNRTRSAANSALITMGSTRGYIDDVRYVSNYSSGMLGTLIAEELYRRGFTTTVIAGSCKFLPAVYSNLIETTTNEEMILEVEKLKSKEVSAAVFAASVLDYQPIEKVNGKISSSSKEMTVRMAPTQKIISLLTPKSKIKVGFKLEINPNANAIEKIAADYISKYNLSLFVLNKMKDVSATQHTATVVMPSPKIIDNSTKIQENNVLGQCRTIEGKEALAKLIVDHISECVDDLDLTVVS